MRTCRALWPSRCDRPTTTSILHLTKTCSASRTRLVWNAVTRERRLLLTLDRDFGRLAIESDDHSGAIVLRPRDASMAMIEALAFRALALATEIDMTNRVMIFEDERIRIRPPLALVPPQDRS